MKTTNPAKLVRKLKDSINFVQSEEYLEQRSSGKGFKTKIFSWKLPLLMVLIGNYQNSNKFLSLKEITLNLIEIEKEFPVHQTISLKNVPWNISDKGITSTLRMISKKELDKDKDFLRLTSEMNINPSLELEEINKSWRLENKQIN